MDTQILCAIDDTEPSENALEFAIDLAKRLSAKLVFCMVNPAVLPSPRGTPVYFWTEGYIQGYLDEALRRARNAGVSWVTCETRRATSVADYVVACADLHEADFIVVGASRHSKIADFFYRSVSRRVADTANCPVIIVKQVRGRWPSGRHWPATSRQREAA
jgi:nucleotide-binding universal stress UspA family protein